LEKIGKDFWLRKLFFYNILKSAGVYIFYLKRMKRIGKNSAGAALFLGVAYGEKSYKSFQILQIFILFV